MVIQRVVPLNSVPFLPASLFGILPIFAGGVINTQMISGVVAWAVPSRSTLHGLILVLLAVLRVTVLYSARRNAAGGGNTHTDIYIVLALLWASVLATESSSPSLTMTGRHGLSRALAITHRIDKNYQIT